MKRKLFATLAVLSLLIGYSCYKIPGSHAQGTTSSMVIRTSDPGTCIAGSDFYGNTSGANAVIKYCIASNTFTTESYTVASSTAALTTSAIASGACSSATTVVAAGVATTDVIEFTPNTDPTAINYYAPSANGSLYIWAYPTSGNVNFKVCNNTNNSLTPSAMTVNWSVKR